MVTLLLLSYCLLEATARATAVAYYVDACNGDDRNAGLSSAHAWRSLERVNAAKLAPGDHVLFQRGDIWRGQLLPQSGAEGLPITYAAYGRGPKPRLLGSVARDRVAEWKPVGDSLWSAGDCAFNTELVLTNFAQSRWHVHCEAGARAPAHFNRREAPSVDHATVQITCRSPGTAAHHIQLSTGGIAIQQGAYYVFEFRARASQRAAISRVGLIEPAAPYHDYSSLACPRLVLQPEWKQFAVRFRAVTNTPNALIVLYLGGGLPVGTTSEFTPLAFNRATFHASEALLLDVGNVIFDHGTKIGVKKWTPADLRVPGDFWYDPETWRLLLRADRNPATLFSSVELALRQHVVSQGGRSWVTYENLAIMYGAAHGIGGGSTHHIQVRDCDFCYLGGGHQFDLPDGRPVRFGNGIEFWADAHDNLVEGCRLWEIYDAALTNQGEDNNRACNLTYRDNVIWNCEYSFEYWNRKNSITRNIRFEHNTCVNAGHGWGHAQRPDPNGRHLMFYHNSAATSGVSIRNNIFSRATESLLRMENDWTSALELDHNCWYQPSGTLVSFVGTNWTAPEFANYQEQTGLDAHSIVADPLFINPEKRDFRLRPSSPARNLSDTRGSVGSRRKLLR